LERVKIDNFLKLETVKMARLSPSNFPDSAIMLCLITISHLDIRNKQLILAS